MLNKGKNRDDETFNSLIGVDFSACVGKTLSFTFNETINPNGTAHRQIVKYPSI